MGLFTRENIYGEHCFPRQDSSLWAERVCAPPAEALTGGIPCAGAAGAAQATGGGALPCAPAAHPSTTPHQKWAATIARATPEIHVFAYDGGFGWCNAWTNYNKGQFLHCYPFPSMVIHGLDATVATPRTILTIPQASGLRYQSSTKKIKDTGGAVLAWYRWQDEHPDGAEAPAISHLLRVTLRGRHHQKMPFEVSSEALDRLITLCPSLPPDPTPKDP